MVIKPKTYDAELAKVEKIAPQVKLFTFDLGERFDFIPGQFIMLELNGVKRAYSLASLPGKKTIELCITIVSGGKLTSKLDKMKVGEGIKVIGPYAMFGREILNTKNDIMFIATGSGVAPMRCLVNHLLQEKFPHKIDLLFGFRYEEDYLFNEEFEELEKNYKNFSVIPTISRPRKPKEWKKDIGRVTATINKHIDSKREYFICGLNDMVKEVKQILLSKGIKEDKIHTESW